MLPIMDIVLQVGLIIAALDISNGMVLNFGLCTKTGVDVILPMSYASQYYPFVSTYGHCYACVTIKYTLTSFKPYDIMIYGGATREVYETCMWMTIGF